MKYKTELRTMELRWFRLRDEFGGATEPVLQQKWITEERDTQHEVKSQISEDWRPIPIFDLDCIRRT